MSGVVLRLRSKCPQRPLGDINLTSSDLWLAPRGAIEGPEASLFCIGGGAIVQDTLSVTSWSFRAEGADSVMCKAFLRGYKLQVVTMQRHMIVDVDALAETRVFDKPVLLERGIPITVRLVPKDEKMIAQCMRDYLNAPGNPLSEIRFVFEMSGSVIDRVNPCSLCGAKSTMLMGAEPRCEMHGDVRISRLSRQVAEFHKAFDLPTATKPVIPSDDRIRLRLKLIAEEFFELLEACNIDPTPLDAEEDAEVMVMHAIETRAISVNLPELADAMGDLDYVVEGTRLEFGINGAPIADAIHAANMAKRGGRKREDGKWMKPEGWQAPDIVGELRKQGWEG